MRPVYAHSVSNDTGKLHSLEDHLHGVAELSRCFGKAFDSEAICHVAGLLHDLGKCSDAFQAYINPAQQEAEWTDHKLAGAQWSFRYLRDKDPVAASVIAYLIAGHHKGLPDSGSLQSSLQTPCRIPDDALGHMPAVLGEVSSPSPPTWLRCTDPALMARPDQQGAARYRLEFWVRMLFSCLVDADYLDTERHFTPSLSALRSVSSDDIQTLSERLDAAIDAMVADADPTCPTYSSRQSILDDCRKAALEPSGVFSLTVPTGGGKTLSSMSFALRHAAEHGKERVIVVIPFTSIIEQNAAIYRNLLGDANVLEHHASLDPEREKDAEWGVRHKLATENWNVPVIVTTTVQFFESLFAASPSRCRKIHSIANSVVILDEVQTLPKKHLHTLVDALGQLSSYYNTTVLLSTATPPALEKRTSMPCGLEGVREVISNPSGLSQRLARVRYDWSHVDEPAWAPQRIAMEMQKHSQVLCVVGKRAEARQVARLLPAQSRIHLSALMCAAHRTDKLALIRDRLRNGKDLRLISTQLIEAGVDVDFPVVYRALAGLDSIVQAAGRCNREGYLDNGRIVIFPGELPRIGPLEQACSTTRELLAGGIPDVNDPETFERYFLSYYGSPPPTDVQGHRLNLDFQSTAKAFRLIDDTATPIIVSYKDARRLIAELRKDGPSRDLLRKLQRYTVTVYERDVSMLHAAGALEVLSGGIHVLSRPFHHLYDEEFGLVIEEPILTAAIERLADASTPPTPPVQAELTDVAGVAVMLGVTDKTARKMDRRGELPSPITIGSRKKWRIAGLRAWIAAGAPSRERWESRTVRR